MTPRLAIDFETRSMSDLRSEGAYKYSCDPTTQPTCLVFKVKGQPKTYFLDFKLVNTPWDKLPLKLCQMWERFLREGFEFSAHNAFFERCIYENILVDRHGWPPIPARSWRCTAAKAAAMALPRSLAGAGTAMQLQIQKDFRGYHAMMATCKPTRAYEQWVSAKAELKAGKKLGARKLALTKQPKPPVFLEYADNPETWEVLYEYCRIDVKTEECLDDALPDLSPTEQEIWHLNQTLNWRGLLIDIPTVKKIIGMMEIENTEKLKELDKLTMGLVTKPGARQSILDFLSLEGIELPNLQSQTVKDTLADDSLSGDMRRLLEIRQALSKISTKKYQAFIDRAGNDNRVRDILLYHGASTGRDTGSGIQPHNFPRGLIKVSKERPYAAVENVIELDREGLQLLYGESLSILFSALLRNMIIPSKGCELYVADFSKIEVAVLWWLADNKPGLEILQSGRDPYKYMAAANTGKKYEEIADEGDERQLGKAQVLGAGFRMGWQRFKDAAWDQYRLKLTNKQSVEAIKSYRENNPAVVELWENYENAAVAAVKSPGQVFKTGKCSFQLTQGFLFITLPSGRKLAFQKPEILWRSITFSVLETDSKGREKVVEKTGKPKETVQHLGLDLSKKNMSVEYKHGGIWTENIVQAVARDLQMLAALRLEKANYRYLLGVHDEALTERKMGEGSLKEFETIMCARPAWADKNLPIQAKAWRGPRYKK